MCPVEENLDEREKKTQFNRSDESALDEQNLKGEKYKLTGVKRRTAHSQAKYPP